MMENNKLNFPKQTVHRDEWSDDEMNFFIQRYNLYLTEIGKNKQFRSKKAFFSWIATEMALIGSSKTADQISSRYYTLTRASKKSKEVTSDIFDGGASVITMIGTYISNMNDLSTVDINEPAFVYVNEEGSVLTNETETVDMNGPTFVDVSETSDEASTADRTMLAVLDDTSNIHMNESAEVTDTSEASTADMIGYGYMSTDGYETSNIINNESAIVVGTNKHINTEKAATVDNSTINRNRNYSFPRFSEPFRAQNATNIGVATVYNISSRIGMSSINPMKPIGTTLTKVNTSDDTRVSGNVPLTSTGSSSIFRIAEVTSLARSSSIAGTSCADSASLARITEPSNSSRICRLTNSSQASISSTTPRNAASLSSGNSSVNDYWADAQTKWLLDQYYYYMDDVGPLKTFRTKNDMWQRLATVMTTIFGSNRTEDQLKKRVASVIAAKKDAVDRNRKSGATRVNIEYEEEISRIAAIDDSIEPEVLRDAHSVYYKKSSKKMGQPETKKPRWDKPNKKSILSTLSESMLSIEQRRTEREKVKEERRTKVHEETIELIRSMKRHEH